MPLNSLYPFLSLSFLSLLSVVNQIRIHKADSCLFSRYCGGAVLSRTYDTYKDLYNSVFFLTLFRPIYYGPP